VEGGHDQSWEQGVICTAVLPCIIVKVELELISDRMCDNISQYASIKELWVFDYEAFSLALLRATLYSLIHKVISGIVAKSVRMLFGCDHQS
jgi:hypothetical protein